MEPLENRVLELENTISQLLEHIQDVKTSITHGFEKVTEKLDALRGNSSSSIENVEIKLDDLKTEISKINDITGYEDMFKNAKSLKIVKEG